MRAIRLIALLLLATTAAWSTTNSVKIGTLKYVGTSVNQFGIISLFEVTLDVSAVTAQRLTFGDIIVSVGTCQKLTGACTAASQDLGGQGPTTTPVQWTWLGGINGNGLVYPLPSCNHGCLYFAAQLLSATGKPFTFRLRDGESFTAWGVSATAFITPQAGQLFIKPGQTASIILYRDALGK